MDPTPQKVNPTLLQEAYSLKYIVEEHEGAVQ
jgi:hypothetical protein